MDYLSNSHNKILEKQRMYQNDTRALYWRPPRSKLYLNSWFAGLAFGLAGVSWGAFQMIKGKPTEA